MVSVDGGVLDLMGGTERMQRKQIREVRGIGEGGKGVRGIGEGGKELIGIETDNRVEE